MNKRASANMWWIIIGAVIALVVMIILMVMFTGKTQPLEQGLSACQGKGGVCVTSGTDCPINTFKSSAFDCSQNQDCCIGAPKKCQSANDCNIAKGETCDNGLGYCVEAGTFGPPSP